MWWITPPVPTMTVPMLPPVHCIWHRKLEAVSLFLTRIRRMSVLSNQLIEKSEGKIVIDNKAVYWRDSFVVAILHEQLYLMVAALPLYPKNQTTLFYDQAKYPAKQVLEMLREKYGPHGDEKYRPPSPPRIDVLDEARPRNLDELYRIVENCKRRFDARIYTPNWERDFSQVKHHAVCLEGDRAFFKGLAQSALDENRVQVSNEAKSLLSREDNAMIAFGICVSALDAMNPYRSSRGGNFDREESQLGASYA
jgi:hypothetical protein